MENGLYPFVKLTSSSGVVTPAASDILRRAQRLLEEKRQLERDAQLRKSVPIELQKPDRSIAIAYNEAIGYVHQKYNSSVDHSRVDYAVAKHLLHIGYARDAIECEMFSNTEIQVRKRGHVQDYVQRTLNAALKKR